MRNWMCSVRTSTGIESCFPAFAHPCFLCSPAALRWESAEEMADGVDGGGTFESSTVGSLSFFFRWIISPRRPFHGSRDFRFCCFSVSDAWMAELQEPLKTSCPPAWAWAEKSDLRNRGQQSYLIRWKIYKDGMKKLSRRAFHNIPATSTHLERFQRSLRAIFGSVNMS